MSSAPAPHEIARDATWLAQALDPGAGMVRLVAMDAESYRAASFLDDRLMSQALDMQIVPWPEIESAVQGHLRIDARWIFHIGHAGSTLVSRLIGELDDVLAIREPRLLRDLALSPPEVRSRYVAAVPKIMSRTFKEQEAACVKATSFASEIAAELVPSGERALFVYTRPLNYIASILGGENSVKELHALAEYRRQRLVSRAIELPKPRTDADRAAAAWACEFTALEAAFKAMADRRIAWADFDTMLGNMPAELDRVARFFGFAASESELADIVAGPLMRRYSKDPGYEYSPDLRERLIEQEQRLQGRDIDAALAMLQTASEESPLLAQALGRAEGS